MNNRCLAVLLMISAGGFFVLPAQSPGTPPKFEVASIKPCKAGEGGGSARSGDAGGTASTGRLVIHCESVEAMIWYAYDIYAKGPRTLGGRQHLLPPIEGAPAWTRSDLYRIEATPENRPEGAPDAATMRGPMLQALLEDRFGLKIHRGTKEVPAYSLVVSNSSPKLTPAREGGCFAPDAPPVQRLPLCGIPKSRRGPNNPVLWDIPGIGMDGLSSTLQRLLNRPVANRTGIDGVFDVHLEFALDESISPFFHRDCGADCSPQASDPADAPSIFTAIQQQLGLKLEATKSSGETLIVDHIQRPSEN